MTVTLIYAWSVTGDITIITLLFELERRRADRIGARRTCSNIPLFIIFHIIYDYTIKGAIDEISTDSMLT